ncbi:unnamed protein product [Cuscuta epithymum]|uniref:Seed biotin-containing protein SBP65 n=1 Tax=Cuscuta epithymum TaxID=186058 RepID=A0AAV0DWZ1_9ASTE|nr:unnamed protein product [Cuscuta epithymum]
MTSEQKRRENQTDERSIHVDKDRVPKMASHFESLADKSSETAHDIHPGAAFNVTETVVTSQHDDAGKYAGKEREARHGPAQHKAGEAHTAAQPIKVGGLEFSSGGQNITEEDNQQFSASHHQPFEEKPGGVKFYVGQGGETNKNRGSLEEIGKSRQTAQQNSIDALRTAQEKYEKAKESATHVVGSAGEMAGKAKNTALQKGQEAFEMTKEYTVPRTEQAKETLTKAGEVAKDYTVQAKDRGAEMGKNAASFTGQKAAAVKDTTVESGKGAAQYAGKVADTVKDKATVVGWEAARFTAERAADATNLAAGVAVTVAGYAGQTAVAAKDVVAGAGKSAAEYAGDKLAAAKDYVVSAEESAAQYAARKKAEAQREAQAKAAQREQAKPDKKSTDSKGESGGGRIFSGSETKRERGSAGENGTRRLEPVEREKEEHDGGKGSGGGGGVLQAIGETIVEIGQTTKELVTGSPDQPRSLGPQ